MESQWKTNILTCGVSSEICTYGLLCTPCLFGRNASKIIHHPGCEAFALNYMFNAFTGSVIGTSLGILISNGTPIVSHLMSLLCSSVLIGSYAGRTRSLIRQKYGIEGDENTDVCLHTFCSPCATCQEAYEIRENHTGYEAPIVQKFINYP